MVSIHNFCGSAGTIKFMDRPDFIQRYKVNQWYAFLTASVIRDATQRPTLTVWCRVSRPLYVMVTAGELEGALTGGLWNIWMRLMSEPLPPELTLHDVFVQAKDQYMRDSAFVLVDKVMLGWDIGETMHSHLRRILCDGVWGVGRGCVSVVVMYACSRAVWASARAR